MNFKFDNMKTGDYKKELKVYGRHKKKCFRCYNKINKMKIAGRGSHFCPVCQNI